MGETNKPNQPDPGRDAPGKSQQQGSPGQRQNPNQQGGGMGQGQGGGKQPGPDTSSPDRGRKASDEEEDIQERKGIDDEMDSPRGEPGLENPVRVPGDDTKNPISSPGE